MIERLIGIPSARFRVLRIIEPAVNEGDYLVFRIRSLCSTNLSIIEDRAARLSTCTHGASSLHISSSH